MNNKALIVGSVEFVSIISSILEELSEKYVVAVTAQEAGKILMDGSVNIIVFDDYIFTLQGPSERLKILKVLKKSGVDLVFISFDKRPQSIIEARDFGAKDYIFRPLSIRELSLRLSALIKKKNRIACIGGGTGLFHLLSGLKTLHNCFLTSIVSMSDSGGSSGALRVSFGVLPPGDVRRSLVALSNAPEILNRLMQHRFMRGDSLSGHSLGNLFLVALNEIKGSMSEAVRELGDILHIDGIVIPIADTQSTLCVRLSDGTVVKGEEGIGIPDERDVNLRIKELWHEPETRASSAAYASIINSDFVIIGPGDLYTSVITNLAVKGISEAILLTKAKKIYVCNLMTKPGETKGYSAPDHVEDIIRYIGKDCLDYIIVSNSKLRDESVYDYSQKEQHPVKSADTEAFAKITRANVVLADVSHVSELVRHDHAKLSEEINTIIGQK